MHPPPPELPLRYSVLRPLGRGGEGSVYLVRDEFLDGALLALKVLLGGEGGGTPAVAESLSREFLTLLRLAHPALSRVRDFGHLKRGGGVFFTSDYARGRDLLQRTLERPFSEDWDALYSLAAQALGALHAIHAAGYVHGDVKPAHLIVDDEAGAPPRLVLIDLGNARLRRRLLREVRGTPAYLAPPVLGDGPEADLYSLGLSLFHAVAGRLPFSVGDEAELDAWRRAARAVRPNDWVDGVPRPAQELIERLTGPPGNGRFRSAREALEFLDRKCAAARSLPGPSSHGCTLVGRDRELQAALAEIASPRAALVLLAAPPGLGKSRLLHEVLRRAQVEGFETLPVTAQGSARGLARLRDLAAGGRAGPMPPDASPDELGAELARRTAAQRIVIGLDEALDPAAGGLDADAGAARAWTAFTRAFLLQPSAAARVVAATSRPDLLRRSLGAPSGRMVEVRVPPLSRDALRDLAVEYFGTSAVPEALIERLGRDSGGSPALARQALADLARRGARIDPLGMVVTPAAGETGSPGGERPTPELAERRFVQLESAASAGPARGALAILALAPEPLDAHRVAILSQILEPASSPTPAGEWERILEELEWQGLVCQVEPGSARYTLPAGRPTRAGERFEASRLSAVRREILRDLEARARSPEARDADLMLALTRAAIGAGEAHAAARAARRAVSLLRAARRDHDALSILEELRSSRLHAALPPRTARLLLLREAELALRSGRAARIDSAAALLDRELPGLTGRARAAALLHFSRLEEAGGRFARAAESTAEALPLVETADGGRRARWYEAAARLAGLRFALGQPGLGRQLIEHGRELARSVSASAPAAASAAVEAGAVSKTGPVSKTGGRGEIAGECRALARFGALAHRHGEPELAAALLQASLALAQHAGQPGLEWPALHELALARAGRGQFAEAEAVLGRCRDLAEETGNRSWLLKARINLATLFLKQGDIDRAEPLFLEARLLAEEIGEDEPAATAWMGLEFIRRDRGDLLGALRLGRALLGRFRRSRPTLHATAHFNLGEIYLALGRPEAARRHRARALAMSRAHDYALLAAYSLAGLGAVRWAVGDLAGAGARLDAAWKAAQRPLLQGSGIEHQLLALIRLHQGLVAASRGDRRSAFRDLGAAMFHSRRWNARPQFERALLAIADLLLRAGDRAKAGLILRRADGAFGRHRSLAGGLRLRASPDWPSNLPDFLAALEESQARGDIFAALCLASDAARDPCWEGRPHPELLARLEQLQARFLRKCPGRDLRRIPRIQPGPRAAAEAPQASSVGEASSVGAAASVEMEGSSDPLIRLAQRWAQAPHSEPRGPLPKRGATPRIEAELRRLREALRADGVWVLNPPGSREPMFYSAGESGPPLDLFSSRAKFVESVRAGGGPHWADGSCLMEIPGERERLRVLYVEAAGGAGAPGEADLRSRIELAAGLLGCFLRLWSAESSRAVQRARLEEAQREVHRLNALLAEGKGELKTAVITQRLLAVERRRARDAGSSAQNEPVMPVARSQAMSRLFERLRAVAAAEIPVLLVGEHGVGKDLLARWIHAQSPRRKGPFVSEVCSVPESLMESELFGYVRGAFTDAVGDRPGLLQLSHGGSLYLDEIAEMSASLQARLLRVIEERRARPLGAEAAVPIDFRLISSTTRGLPELETSGALRRDLLYRIRGEVLQVPPLRDRREDFPELVRAFAEACARERGLPPPTIPDDLLVQLARREWPGNVRQLENEVRRAFHLDSSHLRIEAFEEAEAARPAGRPAADGSPAISLRKARADLEHQLITAALRKHAGNASRAARSLAVSRRYLSTLLEKHGIRLADFTPRRRTGPEGDQEA